MPAPTPAAPAAAPAQSANAGFFIPQSSTTTTSQLTTNLTESPVLSSPSPKGQSASPAGNSAPTSSKKKLLIGLGMALVVLLLIGGGAAFYLTRSSEDNRQQASTPSGSAQLTLTPSSGTFESGTSQEIAFNLNLTTTPVTLSAIELSVAFSGQVPTDLNFESEILQNFQPANTSVIDSETGKTLKIIYQIAGTQGFSASTSKISLGTLTFTTPDSGQLSLRFNASESKVVLQQSNVDILRPPSLIAYTFQSAATPTLTAEENQVLENQVIDQASDSAEAPPEEPGTGGVSPTATPALLAQAITTTTPTRTPTRTPTPALSSTPTPTTARESSLPADTQETPVSGSVDLTLTLFGSGLLLMITGFFFLLKKQKLSK